jgi:phage terminase small subunit
MKMARPRKPESQLKMPRRIKTPDGQPIRPKGRPPKDGVVKVTEAAFKSLIAATGNPPPPVTVSQDGEVLERTNFTPLEYALYVMNDPSAPREQRDRLAIAAMPFVHTKKGEGGKRDQIAENADKAATGKFGAIAQPLRAVK